MADEKAQIRSLLAVIFPAWEHLTEEERDRVTAATVARHYAKGTQLADSRGDNLGVINVARGVLRAYAISDEGRQVSLFRVERGHSCLISADCAKKLINFDVLLEALTDTDVLVIEPEVYDQILSENIYLEAFSYRHTAARFSQVMKSLQRTLLVSFDKRMAGYLMHHARRTNSLTINSTHEEMARDMGSAREVVSRMLKRFERDGLVKLDRGTVTILEPEKLFEMSDLS